MAEYARIIIDVDADARLIETDELTLSDEFNRFTENVEQFVKNQRLVGITAQIRTE